MAARTDESTPAASGGRFPWLLALGVIPFVGSAMLAGRLIWEQTVLTWERGPQMVGFSLAHGSGAVLLLFPPLLILWTVVVATLIVWKVIRKRRIKSTIWLRLGLAILIIVLLNLPGGFWQRVFIRQMASSRRAGDLLVDAAYRGDLGTVRAMLSHGVPINTTDRSQWHTSLHAAASAGDLHLMQFLVANGADVNALDRAGDSPLELAASNGHTDCADLLAKHGGKRIRGDDAQHQKAIDDQVRDDIEEMNSARSR